MLASSIHVLSTERFYLVGWTPVTLCRRLCGGLVVVNKPRVKKTTIHRQYVYLPYRNGLLLYCT